MDSLHVTTVSRPAGALALTCRARGCEVLVHQGVHTGKNKHPLLACALIQGLAAIFPAVSILLPSQAQHARVERQGKLRSRSPERYDDKVVIARGSNK